MTWGKQNLVTLIDGSDIYKCSDCGVKIKYFGLEGRPTKCPECHGTGKRDTIVIFGGWLKTCMYLGYCSFCGMRLVKCPKKGHPNSHFWYLKKFPDEFLAVCPMGCLEDGSWVFRRKARRKKFKRKARRE